MSNEDSPTINEIDALKAELKFLKTQIPQDWQPYILAGMTMLKIEGLSDSNDIPCDVDFVWDKKISFSKSVYTYRAMYIIRPRVSGMSYLPQEEGGWLTEPLIVGVSDKTPGYAVFKMSRVSFSTT